MTDETGQGTRIIERTLLEECFRERESYEIINYDGTPEEVKMLRKAREEWKKREFVREPKGDMEGLLLIMRAHQKYGYHLIMNRYPYDFKRDANTDPYHFNTGSPVPEQRVPEIIREYLEAVKQGRKYSLE